MWVIMIHELFEDFDLYEGLVFLRLAVYLWSRVLSCRRSGPFIWPPLSFKSSYSESVSLALTVFPLLSSHQVISPEISLVIQSNIFSVRFILS